ncbi:hypothetical protein AG1IA_07767 [Rhizoctonia solani AG-1 IA]|uniref:Uncharacterized protein n=1 Tax=Thanatephorus cucumeris (strain AG1-IA) TaxID=983506 RepID=L8WPD6_THACA|nr:hypothetical protein AG1IA_07767 [Rhizoctonia solani AG-1 IA]
MYPDFINKQAWLVSQFYAWILRLSSMVKPIRAPDFFIDVRQGAYHMPDRLEEMTCGRVIQHISV